MGEGRRDKYQLTSVGRSVLLKTMIYLSSVAAAKHFTYSSHPLANKSMVPTSEDYLEILRKSQPEKFIFPNNKLFP